ncbi:DUF501 domain-containing protein [Actinoplanes sp. GCM10030250]|uniref:DUF501 domain-containing protein n=1 Tax=Actinoplanes sp. GCM10030250 TaxID=3273376 RepID=UPI0036190003
MAEAANPGPSPADLDVVAAQLGRRPRGTRAIAHRCPCGNPDVVETSPRLDDGTPFPTLFYLTCPRATAACSRLESAGVMRDMQERLSTDPVLAKRYAEAHQDYLDRRTAIEDVPEIANVSAGGMPDRVKCLHVHLGHALAAGPGVNPFGDEVRDAIGPYWAGGSCVHGDADS